MSTLKVCDFKNIQQTCPVCGSQLHSYLEPWLLQCGGCDFWKSLLVNSDCSLFKESLVVEEHRQNGLKTLRDVNNRTILNLLERFINLKGKRLLDVGCAYGWFLQKAKCRGMVAVGIEPEDTIAQVARQNGNEVISGYFPSCVNNGDQFDVIAFNDVLEHLPDPIQVLKASTSMLTENGKIVVSIPVSTGLFYRISLLFAKLGYRKPLYRLWQKDFRSPHVTYFNAQNLSVMAVRLGLRLICHHPLKTLTIRGLWSRLNMDRAKPTIVLTFTYLCLVLLIPLLNVLMPNDLELFIFELKAREGA